MSQLPASICHLTFYLKSYIIYDRNGENNMPRMTKYQLDHFCSKTNRTYDPLIEEQELLVKQYTTEATNRASKELAVKIGAQKIIDALKSAEEMLTQAQKSAQSFLRKKRRLKKERKT